MSLELLWCAAHAYCVLTNEYQKAHDSGAAFFNSGATSRCRRALTLYDWALRKCVDRLDETWPSDATMPTKEASNGSDIWAANELFLISVAWIIHHEIAHVHLGHPTVTTRSIDEEKEADLSGTKWVLPDAGAIAEITKRTLGIATAILVLTACDLRAHSFRASTHPRSFERLMYCVAHGELAEDHRIYAVIFVLLQIHLADVPRLNLILSNHYNKIDYFRLKMWSLNSIDF
ncbi:MAG: phage exclusion protein Lit family protein, partial [Pseudomonadota bacterium]